MLRRCALIAILFGAPCAPAWAQFEAAPAPPQTAPNLCAREPEAPPAPDSFLTDEALRQEFADRRLEGCYPNGSRWAERTAAGGLLYDDLQGGVLVGDWWVEDGQICYFYPATMATRDEAACWQVIKDGGDYYFFFPGTSLIGGASYESALVS